MKNSRFPAFALLSRHFQSSRKCRTALVLALIAVVSSLPFYSFAQGEAVVQTKKSLAYTLADRGSFILYAGPKGETLCREATPQEALAIRNGKSGEGDGLIQINHLKGEQTAEGVNGLTIVLRATAQLDANAVAKQAFINAAAKWESLIKNSINIVIDVDYGTTFFGDPFSASNVIGATSAVQFLSDGNYPDVRTRLIDRATSSIDTITSSLPASAVPTDIGSVNTVLIASPLMRALGLFSPDYVNDPGSRPQPKIGFNSAFGFDFDPSNGINSGQTDFDAVAVHEIGHVLGFNSEVGARELDAQRTLGVTVWDLFRFRPGTATNASTFTTANRILSSGGTHVQFNGGSELGLSTGRPDGNEGDDEQASHWKDDRFGGGFIGIMDPTIARGVRETMTANDQNTIDSLGYSTTPTVGPPNDNFVSAQTISGNSGLVNGTNVFATKEPGEPIHDPLGFPSGASVWYRWTAPNSGTVTMNTNGSDFDTLLAVYTGSAVNGLTLVASHDDEDTDGGILTSRVDFSVVGGTTYQIAVDGYGGVQGNITLNWSLPAGGTPTPTPTPTPANTVQFSSSTASVNETPNATIKVDLLVTRTGNTTAAASVKYATSNGTASDRSDYEAAAGTLQFAAGETQKTITVFIVDDSYSESPETFNVTLSNPVACTLGSPAVNTVTITSDDVGNGPNPINNAEFFVRQHYLDFFNREPDASGLAFWTNEITQCGNNTACIDLKRTNVSAAFYLSIEFQETGYLVYRMYKVGYGNLPGAPVPVRFADFLPDLQQIGNGVVVGSPDWQTRLNNNKIAFALDFVSRPTFSAAHSTSLTPAQFVDALFANGNVTPGAADRTAAINEFGGAGNTADTAARARALRLIAENGTLSTQEFNKAFVLMQYFGYMRRNPYDPPEPTLDYAGFNFWLNKLVNEHNGNYVNAEMVRAFIVSNEYRLRFGP